MASSPTTTSAPAQRRQTAFISGPLEPSPIYFSEYYEPRLQAAIRAQHRFILGPAPGIDSLARSYLLAHGVAPDDITVYVTEFEAKKAAYAGAARAAGVRTVVVGVTTAERDAQMTRDSDYDILRYRTEEECRALYGDMCTPGRVSATERNERRRRKLLDEAARGSGDALAGGGEERERGGGGVFEGAGEATRTAVARRAG